MAEAWTVNSDASLEGFIKHARQQYATHGYITYSWKTGKQRTATQNNALHKYFAMLADALNDAGLDMKATLRDEVEIPWNADLVKQHLWRPVQVAKLGKESTVKLERAEVSQIYDIINRHLGAKFGLSVPFPESER